MPLYEYECTSCGERTEVIQRLADPPLTRCTSCGGEVRKLISAPAFQFKGSGWYVTDYAAKSSKSAGDAGGESGSSKGTAAQTADKPSVETSGTNESGGGKEKKG